MMVSTVRGTLGPVKGRWNTTASRVESIKADITIDVSGVNTGNELPRQGPESADLFEVAKYPTATFKSKRAEPAARARSSWSAI